MLSPCSLLISKNLHAFKHMVVTQDAFQAVYFSFIKLFLLSPSYEKAKKKKKNVFCMEFLIVHFTIMYLCSKKFHFHTFKVG